MFLIMPAGKMKRNIKNDCVFALYKMVFHVMRVEIIDHKDAGWFQTLSHCPHGIIMLAACVEISEACKKIKSIIEIINVKRQSHIVLEKMEIFRLGLFCLIYKRL